MPSDPAVPPPPVPEGRLTGGWERTEDSVDRLYGVAGSDVRGHTLVYEDAGLRAAVREATDGRVDQSWRFFFATRLRFRPPLPPWVSLSMTVAPVAAEAVRSFVADLEDRGVTGVERGRGERVRTGSGERVRLRQVTGELPVADADAVPVEGWVGAWAADDVYVAGGAYPRRSLATAFGDRTDDPGPSLDGSPSAYRDELLDLVRAVG